jgi:septum formation protein
MSLWLAADPLVLASGSAVRRQMLEAAGIPLDVHPADIDERAIEAAANTADAGEIAALLAEEKARAVSLAMPGRLVIGADQTLALGIRRFSKPENREAAAAQLRALRGRTHQLHSALATVRDGVVLFRYVSLANMKMRQFSDEFLDRYLHAAGERVTQSVGCYQLEGLGVHLFEAIDGDYFTILGLPLLPLLGFLRREGALA